MNSLNIFVQNFFVSTRTPNITEFLFLLTTVFDVSLGFVLLLIAISFLIYRVRGLKYTVLFISSICFTTVTVYVLKYVFNTPRPLDSVFIAHGGSLPSGHATISVVFFIILNYIFTRSFSSIYRKVFLAFSFVTALLVSVSRLYLGVHWLTDVLFGILLGCLISFISIKAFKKYEYSL